MPTSLVAILVLLRSLIRSRVDLQLENLALRHQIGVLQRSLKKRRKNNCNGPPLLGFSVAYMARLALGISHRQAANGCGLASHGLSLVLDLEGSTGTIGTPRDCPRDSRPHPQFVAGESYLGCTPHSRRVVETRHRHRREQCHEDMVRCRKPPSQTCRTFLDNHVSQLVSVDFFTVPTIRFQVLYVFLVLAHDRRRILHFNVTAHPTAAWTGQQLREAFPFDQLPRYLLRDHDAIFGQDFREQLGDMGIEEVLSTPRSPWQRAYVERVIGSIRRECLDHVVVFDEGSLRRFLNSYFNYYQRSRTHLSLKKDSPEPRPIQRPEIGPVVALPQVGGLHHRYQRQAA